MKKTVTLSLILAASLGLAACQKKDETVVVPEEEAQNAVNGTTDCPPPDRDGTIHPCR